MIRVGVNGCIGKMGSIICYKILHENDIVLTEAFERSNSESIGMDLGLVLGIEEWKLNIKELKNSENYKMDIIVDFSSEEGFLNSLEYSFSHKIPFISGTTGISEKSIKKMKEYSKNIPILYSSNMSTGINSILKGLEKMKDILNDRKRDIEIIEYHHNKKKDSPSGTALMIAKKISELTKRNINRNGSVTFPRGDEIRIHSLRLGEIYGYHKIIISGNGETIEISHSALSRETFANGVIESIRFLIDKKEGLYSILDIERR
ncbi:MAG: 4-hydroxy-tetrahydrodipicolinate reductase [bacterium]|uniref:4-hydroxy-tetrahydrodipicolinate reductase n=2 Tax=Bacteria candidate phyla TaxID=1783234 RepID=A0A101I432_UNCT6|nr:MAG: 4-hydroxy-tetrahydrodipicolinate reductase [candidate division TA06 bacterium 32_111]KUK87525.1 MAG: 4-hydroxy-tetrahydrodipicolinate reductase [candidate division TA06 bacterium 34_109]MDI6700321.1 4-hydroxy-tetrahydrodipicolinate reductase [bacterium]HAF08139.1 4-hydroxy-tetrahydrodipicolinate reductase [candidate division WOR-3 bacterium]HCP16701.1 4-hydroxy-tetrahydrodipicolinate reductase [candidate division WOR-3 bacterium]